MKIRTEAPMTHETAWYIMHSNGWNHREGIDRNDEFIYSMRIDESDNVMLTKQINVHREMHTQKLIAVLTVLRIIQEDKTCQPKEKQEKASALTADRCRW